MSDLFFEHLRKLRKEHKLGQEKMADYLGISYSAYRRYELGHREMPLSIAVKLAALYEITLDELVGQG